MGLKHTVVLAKQVGIEILSLGKIMNWIANDISSLGILKNIGAAHPL